MTATRKTTTVVERDPLNRRQRLFVTAYIAGPTAGNATQSAIAAGYSPQSASAQSFELLRHPAIAPEILRIKSEMQAELQGQVVEVLDRFKLERTRVLQQVAIGAFQDMRAFYDEEGNLIPPHKLPYEAACLIEGIEHTPVFEGVGQERRQVGTSVKYKLAKRATYVDMAMKHLGEYKKDNEQAAQAFVGSLAELVNGMKGSTIAVNRIADSRGEG